LARKAVRWDWRGPRGARVCAVVVKSRGPLACAAEELGSLIADATIVVDAPGERAGVIGRRTWARDVVVDAILRATLGAGGAPLRLVLMMPKALARAIVELIEEKRLISTLWETPVDLLAGLGSAERLYFLRRAIGLARQAAR
jgi:hypothetical protein